MDNEELKKQLDELFRLFNKLMEKHPIEDVPGINRMQLEQMRLFLRNYQMMKDQISLEMMGQMNEPVKQMIGMFIQQLRNELGETEPYTDQAVVSEIKDGLTLEEIDSRLRQSGLEEDEINRLLDERARIVSEQNRFIG